MIMAVVSVELGLGGIIFVHVCCCSVEAAAAASCGSCGGPICLKWFLWTSLGIDKLMAETVLVVLVIGSSGILWVFQSPPPLLCSVIFLVCVTRRWWCWRWCLAVVIADDVYKRYPCTPLIIFGGTV